MQKRLLTTIVAALSLTRSLAVEWSKQGINVNAIAPGVFRTELNAGLLDELHEAVQFRGHHGTTPSPLRETIYDLAGIGHVFDGLFSTKKDALMRDFSIKSERIHSVNQLLKAYTLFEKDTEYIVDEGKVKRTPLQA